MEITPFEIKERTKEAVVVNPVSEIDSSVTLDDPTPEVTSEPESTEPEATEPETPTPTPGPTPTTEPVVESTEELPPPPPVEPEPFEEIPAEREPELAPESPTMGPLPLHQKIYTPGGILKYVVAGESDDKTKYLLKELGTDAYQYHSFQYHW